MIGGMKAFALVPLFLLAAIVVGVIEVWTYLPTWVGLIATFLGAAYGGCYAFIAAAVFFDS